MDKMTQDKINSLLTDEKFMTLLRLTVDECNKEKLKRQEEMQKEHVFPEPKKTFTRGRRGKKKGTFLITFVCRHVVLTEE